MKKALLLILLQLYSFNLLATEAIGFYSKGSLKNADSIIEKNVDIHKLFIARQKFFTTAEMLEAISDARDYIQSQYPDTELMQVGDLSPKNGGIATGHASHQNGLDVDIVYLTKNHKLQSPNATYWEEDFVINGKLTSNFDLEKNLMLFKHFVNHSPVERIFVDIVIKKNLCEYAKNSGLLNDPQVQETLRRLRPQDLHSTHFHVRLFCPATDLNCTPQSSVPSGNGCGDLELLLESKLEKDKSC